MSTTTAYTVSNLLYKCSRNSKSPLDLSFFFLTFLTILSRIFSLLKRTFVLSEINSIIISDLPRVLSCLKIDWGKSFCKYMTCKVHKIRKVHKFWVEIQIQPNKMNHWVPNRPQEIFVLLTVIKHRSVTSQAETSSSCIYDVQKLMTI